MILIYYTIHNRLKYNKQEGYNLIENDGKSQ